MGRLVIVGYRPKAGKDLDLKTLVRRHGPILREQGLVTDRASIAMQAQDGTIIEVFEWASAQAIESAHNNPVVQRMWSAFSDVCDFVPVGALDEASQLFSEFTPVF